MENDITLKEFKNNAVSELISNGISAIEANLEADILIEYVFGYKKKDIIAYPELKLSNLDIKKFSDFINKRINEKIPIQYLTNKAYFMGHEFYVDNNVLIPRPETELLVENVANLIKEHNDNIRILDIGTGSGCIAIMLAKLTNQKIIATDISEKALQVAQNNAKKLEIKDKIEFIQSDIFSNIEGYFDIIVSNPPYIPPQDREALQFEVSGHEPALALFAEDDEGLSFYEKLIVQSSIRITSLGYLAVEVGISQSQQVKKLFIDAGFVNIQIIKDYSGIERIVIGEKE